MISNHIVIVALVVLMFALLGICALEVLRRRGIDIPYEMTRFVRRPWFERLFLVFLIAGVVHYGATKGTRQGEEDSRREENMTERVQDGTRSVESDGVFAVTNLCFVGIETQTNGVILDVAWPTNMFEQGTTLDFFAKRGSLTNVWEWMFACPTQPGETNVTLFADVLADFGLTTLPAAMFFDVRDRCSCAATMADSDGDGLPDVYELHNGTNPHVSDCASAPKLTVGPDGAFATLGDALAASTNYSVIALSAHAELTDKPIVMPSHPVMVTGPDGGYAVLRSSANIAAVMMDAGQGSETLFRNLYIVLDARDGFQSAFWIGGNLPWSGVGSSPTFENVRVRAPYPNVLHYGWHYYRDDGGQSSLSNCTMNAAGSTSAIGVYAYDGPEVGVSDCVFVNFPTNDGNYATWTRSGTNVVAEVASSCTNLSWAGYSLDAYYSDTVDSDGDGLSDYEEIYLYDTDPWLADSDGDGLTDAEEIGASTNPRDIYSFYRRVTVVTDALDDLPNVTNYVAWGLSATSWETNDLAVCASLPSANVFDVLSAFGLMYVKAFRDLNRNGQYDSEEDVYLSRQVPPLDAVSSFVLCFGDVDGDGVSDDVERQQGTDPYDGRSFRLVATVSCSDADRVASVTNYLAHSGRAFGADGAFLESGDLPVDVLVTNGTCVVYCLRDFNGNGVYDEGVDVLYSKELTRTDNGTTILMPIGDYDADGQSDSSEIVHGTDPTNPGNYCYNLSLVETDVFSTTNHLTAEVCFGTNSIAGPVVVTNSTWEVDVGHLVASNREQTVVYFWDDANSNAVRDAGECCARQQLRISGHENVITNALSRYPFDRDNDGMLDYWEILHAGAGLSPTNAADAFIDADSDGLINLHEYWTKCNPAVPDGSNTLLSVLSRSVDGRLVDTMVSNEQLRLFVNYPISDHQNEEGKRPLSENLIFNTNCWASGIDFSCVSPWNDWRGRYRAGTVISKRHVLYAHHYPLVRETILYFIDNDGCTYTNKIEATVSDAATDFGVALLENDLPDAIHPARIISEVDLMNIGDGRGVPLIAFDQNERVFVHEVYSWHNSVTGEVPKVGMRANYYREWIGGDSGNPRFLVVSNEVVLVNVAWYGLYGIGTSVTARKKILQSLMDYLSQTKGLSTNDYKLVEFPWQSEVEE